MLHPTTPTKADDEIERHKKSLTAKWGINFPAKDPVWSPSRRDHNRLEDQILACMQFLYFRGALSYAIDQFEQCAQTIYSQWQFKPRAEPDVLPSRETPFFLHKRDVLNETQVQQLTETLWNSVSQVAERVKKGEKFPMPKFEKPKAASISPATKAEVRRRQTSLTQWFRSKSEPKATTTTQQPSSDDFPDEDMVDILNDLARSPVPTSGEVPGTRTMGRSTQPSPEEDVFKTPPSTPPKSKNSVLEVEAVGPEIPNHPDSFFRKKPELVPVSTTKRLCPEPLESPLRRKVSRETRSHCVAYPISYLDPAPQSALHSNEPLAGPIAPSEHLISFIDSTNNLASQNSSFISSTSAGTTKNTSLATSFSSDLDGADATMRLSSNIPKDSLSNRGFPMQSEASTSARNMGCGKAAFDPMDIEPEPTITTATVLRPSIASKETLGETERRTAYGSNVEGLLAERLRSHSPFSGLLPEKYTSVPFRVLYEITRVSIDCKIDLSRFSNCLNSSYTTYSDLWSSLSDIVKSHGIHMPERSSLAAWDRAGTDFDGVTLTGRLDLIDNRSGPVFDFKLHPLKVEQSYRLSRQFGSDRFCVVSMPIPRPDNLPPYLKSSPGLVREAIKEWLVATDHHFLGRKWRAFFNKPEVSKRNWKAQKGKVDRSRRRVYFFAEDGVGFRKVPRSGEADPRILDRFPLSVKELIEWFMSMKANAKQRCLKFYARLALAVSSTTPSVEFEPDEIFRADDALADAPCQRRLDRTRSDEKKTQVNASNSKVEYYQPVVMNDGCARISRNAARGIADSLGLDSIPCVYQGRIGGAKGMWMIDILDEEPPSRYTRNYWIEITDSQLKFEGHIRDAMFPEPARVTFEVNDYPRKLVPSCLNFQLLPILEHRKVPAKVFANLLEKDLIARIAELEVAMDSGLALRKWNQSQFPVTEERARYGGIEMQGGLPASTAEKINWFVEHGFEPESCRYLKDQLYTKIHDYCLRLESRMNIELAQSTYAFMIADPLAILEADEVHIAFSGAFKDPKTGMDQIMLHDIDVLVARLPAHLPSDIQKVRAVFKPELRLYRDVIVFSSKGSVSLASKLSGGDYDGDKAWVCWDSDIVEPFQNAEVPSAPEAKFYGIEEDNMKVSDLVPYPDCTDRFLRRGFDFNFQTNMLGTCTAYHEAYCYRYGSIDSESAILIAMLLGKLVDSPKAGFKFDEAKWAEFQTKHGLPKGILPKPAYKDRKERPRDHLIDNLVFVTAKNTREEVLKKFSERFHDVTDRDDDLFRLRVEAVEESKSNKELAIVLANLDSGLQIINTFWRRHARVGQDDDDMKPRRSNALSFRTVVETCRKDFLDLAPTLDIPPTSDKIISWQRDHAARPRRSSDWDLLKASVAFSHYYYRSTFIWHVAGVELGEIKAMAKGRGTYRTVVGEVYQALKLDSKVVNRTLRNELSEQDGGGEAEGAVDEENDEFWDFDMDADEL